MASLGNIGVVAAALGLVFTVRAEDKTVPADLGPKLEHLAIVEEMVRACGHARSDLSAEIAAAWQVWLQRNPDVMGALDLAQRLAGTPQGDAVLYLFHSLQTSLDEQTNTLEATGNQQYAARCDGIVADLKSGRLDYHAARHAEVGMAPVP